MFFVWPKFFNENGFLIDTLPDTHSIIENLKGQKYVVDSAKKLFSQIPILNSTVTMKQCINIESSTEHEVGQTVPIVVNK